MQWKITAKSFSSYLLFANLSLCSQTLSVLDESTCVQSHCTYSIFPVYTFSPSRISPDQGRGDSTTGHLSLNSMKSFLAQDTWKSLANGHGADAGEFQHITNASGIYRIDTERLKNTYRNTRLRFCQLYFTKAQTVAESKAEEPEPWCGGKWYPEAAKDGDEKG